MDRQITLASRPAGAAFHRVDLGANRAKAKGLPVSDWTA
jgi:hypothetical protein